MESKPQQPSEPTPQEITQRIMGGLALWGGLLALGATIFGVGEDGDLGLMFRPLRGLIVVGCVGAFIGFWALLLRSSNGRS